MAVFDFLGAKVVYMNGEYERAAELFLEGARDGSVSKECELELEKICKSVRAHRSEGIILGCTHFTHLEKTIKNLLPDVEVISPAKIGARELARRLGDLSGSEKTIYTE